PLSVDEGAVLVQSLLRPGRVSAEEAQEISTLCSGLPQSIRIVCTALAQRDSLSGTKAIASLRGQSARVRIMAIAREMIGVYGSLPTPLSRSLSLLSVLPVSFDHVLAGVALGVSSDQELVVRILSELLEETLLMSDGSLFSMNHVVRDTALASLEGRERERAQGRILLYARILSSTLIEQYLAAKLNIKQQRGVEKTRQRELQREREEHEVVDYKLIREQGTGGMGSDTQRGVSPNTHYRMAEILLHFDNSHRFFEYALNLICTELDKGVTTICLQTDEERIRERREELSSAEREPTDAASEVEWSEREGSDKERQLEGLVPPGGLSQHTSGRKIGIPTAPISLTVSSERVPVADDEVDGEGEGEGETESASSVAASVVGEEEETEVDLLDAAACIVASLRRFKDRFSEGLESVYTRVRAMVNSSVAMTDTETTTESTQDEDSDRERESILSPNAVRSPEETPKTGYINQMAMMYMQSGAGKGKRRQRRSVKRGSIDLGRMSILSDKGGEAQKRAEREKERERLAELAKLAQKEGSPQSLLIPEREGEREVESIQGRRGRRQMSIDLGAERRDRVDEKRERERRMEREREDTESSGTDIPMLDPDYDY
ncbi:hypothetical protein KIPB_003160, partial [Kipferlia bialata]